MAIDKAVDSAWLNAGLTSLADAIRQKNGTAEDITWPEGFADAVAAIEAGGSPFDYDIIEYTVTTDSGNNDPGTLYTIPHGLSYMPTWFVAVQVPMSDFASLTLAQCFYWIGLSTHNALVRRMNNATLLQFNTPSNDSGIGVQPEDTVHANCDSSNFYLRAVGWGSRSVLSGSTIYIITKEVTA